MSTTGTLWNGPICPDCSSGYLGQHTCDPAVLLRRAADLIDRANRIALGQPAAYAGPRVGRNGCPCLPENGGSGICGCILGGPQVTCSTQTPAPSPDST